MTCPLGVGCDEAGVCYAAAQGEPERCPAIAPKMTNLPIKGFFTRYARFAPHLSEEVAAVIEADAKFDNDIREALEWARDTRLVEVEYPKCGGVAV